MLESCITSAERRILVYQYVIDHDGLIARLSNAKGRSCDVRIILDAANFKDSSCTRQPDRLRILLDAGVEMRTLALGKGNFAC